MALMRNVDTGEVFKHPVQCFRCDQAFYFTLRKIAEFQNLACPLCGSNINLTDEAYGLVVTRVKETIGLIDQSSGRLQPNKQCRALTEANTPHGRMGAWIRL
jgi:hypothetical protein